MRGIYAFAAAIGINYGCHRTGRPTACQDLRRLPRPAFFALLLAGLAWFVPHIQNAKE